VYRVLLGKPNGKRPFVRPRHRWEDNIRMNLQKVGSMDWIELAQDRDGECGNEPSSFITCREFLNKLRIH
jgi:hypothetical protein